MSREAWLSNFKAVEWDWLSVYTILIITYQSYHVGAGHQQYLDIIYQPTPYRPSAEIFFPEVVNSGWAGHPVAACREGKEFPLPGEKQVIAPHHPCGFSPLNLKSVPNDRKTLGFRDGPWSNFQISHMQPWQLCYDCDFVKIHPKTTEKPWKMNIKKHHGAQSHGRFGSNDFPFQIWCV